MSRIGIDVGGTNTDAVLLGDDGVVAAIKTPTTEDVTGGIEAALARLLEQTGADPAAIQRVVVGTTHFTNAVVQRRALTPVVAVRVGLPASASLPPFCDWPEDLRTIVEAGCHMVRGGNEFDGRPIVPFDDDAMEVVARDIAASGVTSVAVSAVFSPLTAECEERAAAAVRHACPDVAITLSHALGRLGLLERENVTLLNAALIDLARRTVGAFEHALEKSGIAAPLYLTQNDGTIVGGDYAATFPVYGFASGPTNSMRGAAFLSRHEEAVVVDVGGTTTDIGCLRHGFPREANNVVEVGGVRTNFRMPDVLSIGLGGGSLVSDGPLTVGPLSVGYEITSRARVFGGAELTATDIAVAHGRIDLGDASRVADVDPDLVARTMALMGTMIAEAVDRMKPSAAPLPLIAVGGGAFLIPDDVPGISEVIHVPHSPVANAVGAAIAQVGGEADRIFQDVSREEAIDRARHLAETKAVEAGADPATLKTVEVEDLPIAYLPGNALRTRVRVVGDVG